MTKCQTCGHTVEVEYCTTCGEKRFDPSQLSIAHFISQLMYSITNVDGKFFHSLRLLLSKPGMLTLNYLSGVRKLVLTPFQLFVLINIFYFFLLSFIGHATFNTPLEVHLTATNFIHHEWAKMLVNDMLATTGISIEEYGIAFNQRIDVLSKSLIILLIPLFACFVALFFFKQQYISLASLVYSTHFFAFFLIFQITFFSVAELLNKIAEIGFGISINKYLYNELIASLILFLSLAYYLFSSANRVFGQNGWQIMMKTFGLIISLYFALLVYRGLLFFITFYSL